MSQKPYVFTNKLEMLETVRRAIQHGILEIRISDCSGTAVGDWVYMDLSGGILDEHAERYVTEFAKD